MSFHFTQYLGWIWRKPTQKYWKTMTNDAAMVPFVITFHLLKKKTFNGIPWFGISCKFLWQIVFR